MKIVNHVRGNYRVLFSSMVQSRYIYIYIYKIKGALGIIETRNLY